MKLRNILQLPQGPPTAFIKAAKLGVLQHPNALFYIIMNLRH